MDQQDFESMSEKDAFSCQFSQFSAKANDFRPRTPPILSNLRELAQASLKTLEGTLVLTRDLSTHLYNRHITPWTSRVKKASRCDILTRNVFKKDNASGVQVAIIFM